MMQRRTKLESGNQKEGQAGRQANQLRGAGAEQGRGEQ